jgi:hypothetical protein
VTLRIAYLGPPGTFSEEAALAYRPDAELVPVSTIPGALDAVARGDADEAIVPVENSLQGSVTETVYRKPSSDERQGIPLHSGDPVVVYVPGPLADPREFGKVSVQPGGEYLLFLTRAKINPEDFRYAVEQVSGTAMMEWRAFPDSRLIYFTPVRDPFATLLLEGAWTTFLVETRAVAQQMPSQR